ncbi:hypothetical protein AK812_SmicGene25476 [Symbiodinium microadriaticum]|uniref:C2H2-type domain-containing protein n=1 Tax=Symbiodinium microadriaticum TaxID=2951 RepID=A0A1Q9DC81_SYMMI|nr:hypothetical protein AK812_SmicGene25476 [Symbiodinium microadriaticum]
MGRGRKQPWKEDDQYQHTYQRWRGAYSPQLRSEPQQRPWRQPQVPPPSSKAASFPTYTNMPQSVKEVPTKPATGTEVAHRPRGRVHGIQHLLNAARKAELKVHRLQAAKTRREDQWSAFNKGLKESFLREQSKFQRDSLKADQDIQEAMTEQDRAYQIVRAAFLGDGPPPDVEMVPDAQDEQWDQLKAGWAQEDDVYLQDIISRSTAQPSRPLQPRQLSPEVLEMLSHFGAAQMAQLAQQSMSGMQIPQPAPHTEPVLGTAAAPLPHPVAAAGAPTPAEHRPPVEPPPATGGPCHNVMPPPTSEPSAPAAAGEPQSGKTASPAGHKAKRALLSGNLPQRQSVKALPKTASPQTGGLPLADKLAMVREAAALKQAAAAAGMHAHQVAQATHGNLAGPSSPPPPDPVLTPAPAEHSRALHPFGVPPGTGGPPADTGPGATTVGTLGSQHVPIFNDDTDSEMDKATVASVTLAPAPSFLSLLILTAVSWQSPLRGDISLSDFAMLFLLWLFPVMTFFQTLMVFITLALCNLLLQCMWFCHGVLPHQLTLFPVVFVPYCQPVNGRVITDRPQQFLGMMDVISYHSILDHLPTPARAVVLDLSRVGGHCHATVLPACTTWETVADQVCKLLNLDIFEEPVNIWKGDHMELIDKFSIFHLQHGDTLIFMRGDLAPPVVFTAADFFGAGVKWYGFAHLPDCQDTHCLAVCTAQGLYPVDPHYYRHVPASEIALHSARLSPSGYQVTEIAATPVLDLDGETCAKIQVVTARSPTSAPQQEAHYLLDLRPISQRPRLITFENLWPDLPDILTAAGVSFPKGQCGELLRTSLAGSIQVLTVGVATDLATRVFSTGDWAPTASAADSVPGPHPTGGAAPWRHAQHRQTAGPYAPPRFDREPCPPSPHQALDLDEGTDTEAPEEGLPFRAGVHIMIPDFRDEILHVMLSAPCSLDDALCAFAEARDSTASLHLDVLIPAHPQPDPSFACVLALPSWTTHASFGVADLRAIDGRLFSYAFPARLNRSSILLQLGVQDSPGLQVYVADQLLEPFPLYELQLGITVTVLPSDFDFRPGHSLEMMLQRDGGWAFPCPTFGGLEGPNFLILSDGLRRVLAVDETRATSSAYLKQEAVRLFRYEEYKVTVCPTVPRTRDATHLGWHCDAVFVAAEAINRTPVPPGRLQTRQHIVFLDMRLLLQHFDWQLAPHGVLDKDKLSRRLQTFAPEGFSVSVHGGRSEHRGVRTFLHVAHGEVLTCVPVEDAPSADIELCSDAEPSLPASHQPSSSSSDMSDSSSDGVEAHEAQPARTHSTTSHSEPIARSRSPEGRRPTATGPGTRGFARQALLGLGCVHLGHPVQGQAIPQQAPIPPDPAIQASTAVSLLRSGILRTFSQSPPPCLLECQVVTDTDHFCFAFLLAYGQLTLTRVLSWALLLLFGTLSPARRIRIRSTSNEARAHKLLVEPSGRTPHERSLLRTLRSLTRQLGGRWLRNWSHQPHEDAPFGFPIPEDTDSEQEDTVIPLHFVVLKHDYVPERLVASLRLPATPSEATALLRNSRDPTARHLFPALLPVTPQPRPAIACFIAAPAWNPGWHSICIDTSRIDGRIFAAFAPEYVTRKDILLLSEIPLGIEPVVWVGYSETLLEADFQTHLFPGALVCVFPQEASAPDLEPFGETLLRPHLWHADPFFPEPNGLRAYCLAHRRQGQLYIPDPTRPTSYRRDIAAAVASGPETVHLVPARPRPRDVSISGVPCRTVIGVCDKSHPSYSATEHFVLLDCRPIEMGWKAYGASQGRLDVGRLLDSFSDEAPAGWQACVMEFQWRHGFLPTEPGQILTIIYAYDGPHDFGRRLPAQDYGLSRDAASSSSPQAPAGTGPTPRRANASREAREVVGTPSFASDPQTGAEESSAQARVSLHFLIFTPEYTPERITLASALPARVEDIIEEVDILRDPARRAFFPRLLPVPLQPTFSFVSLLAIPQWPFEGVPFLITCLHPPVRVLPVVGPAVLTAEDVLRLAGVNEDARVRVFSSDVPWPLRWNDRFNVRSGDSLTIIPEDQPFVPPVPIQHFFNSSEGWHPDPVVPDPSDDATWVIMEQETTRLTAAEQHGRTLNEAVAALLCDTAGEIDVLPATPSISDHCRHGLPSARVVITRPLDLPGHVPYIIDSRPVLTQLHWATADQGKVDVASSEDSRPASSDVALASSQPDAGQFLRSVRIIALFLCCICASFADGYAEADKPTPRHIAPRCIFRGRYAVCILLCFVILPVSVQAMPLNPEDGYETNKSRDLLSSGRYAVLEVARPFRNWQPNKELAFPLLAPHKLQEAHITGAELRTLLEDSIASPDSQAFFLAATLLDTLEHHFASDTATEPARPPQISLEQCVPLSEHQQACLALRAIIPDIAPVFDPTDWLDSDLRRVLDEPDLKPQLRELFHGIRIWQHHAWHTPPDAIAIYTDGSADESDPSIPCSWAFTVWFYVQAHPYLYGVASSTAVPAHTPYHAGECLDNAVTAELLALFWALTWSAQYAPAYNVPVAFHYDAISVGRGTFGTARLVNYPVSPQGLSLPKAVAVLRHLATARTAVTHHHVQGHSGHFANELTDRLAHTAGRHAEPYHNRCLPEWPCQLVRHPLAAWAWLQQAPQADLPTVFAFESEAHRLQRSPELPLQGPKAGIQHHPPEQKEVTCRWSCISYNVLTLKDKPGRNTDVIAYEQAGMKLTGRRAVLKQSLDEFSPLFVGLQETRLGETATLPDSTYNMFHSGSTPMGVGGCALWVHRNVPYATTGTVKYFLRQEHATVTGLSPRHLNVVFIAPFLHLFVMVAHGPSPANHPIEEIIEFWRDRTHDVRSRPQGTEILLLTDANAKLGELTTCAVGSCNAEPENSSGEHFHAFLLEAGLLLPSTVSDFHTGPGATWFSSQGQVSYRIDYIGVSETWRGLGLCSKVLTGFESLQLREDHRPVFLSARNRAAQFELLPLVPWSTPLDYQYALDYIDRRKSQGNFLYGYKLYCRLSDRKAYLLSLTQQVQDSNPKDPQSLYRAVRKAFPTARSARRSGLVPLPAVYDEQGQLVTTPADKQECWRRHFAAQELGDEVDQQEYLRRFRSRSVEAPPVFDIAVLPTVSEIEQIILGLKKHRAPGPDCVTADLLQAAPVAASRQLYPVLLKSTLMVQEPVEFRGGSLICLAKRAGAALQCKDFRSILLASVPAKIQHRHLRSRLLPLLEQHGHPTQAGAKAGISVEPVSLLARSFQAVHHKRRLPWAITFYDLQAAFYRVVRETLVPSHQDDRALRSLLHRIGIPSSALEELADQLRNVAALPCMGASPHLTRLIQDLFHGTWFRMDFGDVLTYTSRGTRPGDPAADILFSLSFAAFIRQTEQTLIEQGLESLPSASTTVHPWAHAEQTETVGFPAWADDFAHLQNASQFHELLQRVRLSTQIVQERASAIGMKLTYAHDKTATLLPPGHDWTLHGAVRDEETEHVYVDILDRLTDTHHKLVIVQAYKHLGSILTSTGDPRPDLARKKARALSVVRPLGRRLFGNRAIPLDTRRLLLRSLAVSRFVYSGAALILNAALHQRTWDQAYVQIWRSLMPRQQGGKTAHGYSVLLAARAAAPPLALARARALLLQKLTQHGPSILRTLLYEHWIACPQGAWLSQLQDDVKLITLYVPKVRGLLSTSDPIHDLLSSLQTDPTWWSRQTKAAEKAFIKALEAWSEQQSETTDQPPQSIAPAVPAPASEPHPYACHKCDATFPLRKHLGVHLSRAHGILSPSRHYAFDVYCHSCHRWYGSIRCQDLDFESEDVPLYLLARAFQFLRSV